MLCARECGAAIRLSCRRLQSEMGCCPPGRHIRHVYAIAQPDRSCIRFALALRAAGRQTGHSMKRSTNRILTTHVGSLIRPAALQEFLRAKQAGKPFDPTAYAKCLQDSVAEVVHKQADVGVDIVSDGEFGKSISWSQYV